MCKRACPFKYSRTIHNLSTSLRQPRSQRRREEERNDQTVRSELFERAKELAAGCEIEPSVPRMSAIQRNRANVPAVTPQQYWFRAYLPLVDHLIQEVNDRLLNHNDRFLAWVNTSYLRSSDHSTETTNKIYNTYSHDLSHRVAFDNEIV